MRNVEALADVGESSSSRMVCLLILLIFSVVPSIESFFLKEIQNKRPAHSVAMLSPVYSQTRFGSFANGAMAAAKAAPNAFVNMNNAMMNDFIDGGAFVYAYSRPVTFAKISEMAMKKYVGA